MTEPASSQQVADLEQKVLQIGSDIKWIMETLRRIEESLRTNR